MPNRMLGICLALILLPITLSAEERSPKYYAVLVGVEKYQHPKLREPEPLKYAIEDVQELSVLLSQQGYEIALMTDDSGKTTPELMPTRANILREIKTTLRKCREQDTVVVALAGHGLQFTGQPDAFFCPIDARPFPDESETLVSITNIYSELEKSFAGVKVVLVDACRNDPDPARGRGLDADSVPLPPKGVAALFSCSAGQRAFENEELKHGVFFHFLLQGLRGAVKDIDGGVSFDRLQLYVRDKVTQWAQDNPRATSGRGQSPNLKADLAGKPIQLFPNALGGGSSRYVEEEWERFLKKSRAQQAQAETPRPITTVWNMLIEAHFLNKPLPYQEFAKAFSEHQSAQTDTNAIEKELELAKFEAFWLLAPNVALSADDRQTILDRLERTGNQGLKRLRSVVLNTGLSPSYWRALARVGLTSFLDPIGDDNGLKAINPLILDLHRTVPVQEGFEDLLMESVSLEKVIRLLCESLEKPLELGDVNEVARRRELCAGIFPENWRSVRRTFQRTLNNRLLRSPGLTSDVLLREVADVAAEQRDIKLRGTPTLVMICVCGGLCSTSTNGYGILAEFQQKKVPKFDVVVFGDADKKVNVAKVFEEKKLTARFAPYSGQLDVASYGPVFVGVDEDGRIVGSFASLRNKESLPRLIDAMMKHHAEQKGTK